MKVNNEGWGVAHPRHVSFSILWALSSMLFWDSALLQPQEGAATDKKKGISFDPMKNGNWGNSWVGIWSPVFTLR